MPRGERAPDQRSVSFSCSKKLVSEIDDLAAVEKRSRSNWIVKELEELVRQRLADKITVLPKVAEEPACYPSKKSPKK
jgi:metal-responsive CopG/Arc/MetJ family transcriptional regulator